MKCAMRWVNNMQKLFDYFVLGVIIGVILALVAISTDLKAAELDTQALFNRIAGANNLTAELKIVDTGIVNAWVQSGTNIVKVDQKLIAFCESKTNCVAGPIAHELGHVKLRHQYNGRKPTRDEESAADLEAQRLLVHAGLPCNALQIYFKLNLEFFGDYEDASHYPFSQRIKIMEAECRM